MGLSCPACGKPSCSLVSDSISLRMCNNEDCRVSDFFSGDE